jgi:predicted nucleic acid-binding protein
MTTTSSRLALAVNADVIVTGDKDLLALSQYRSIRVLTARAFLTELGG